VGVRDGLFKPNLKMVPGALFWSGTLFWCEIGQKRAIFENWAGNVELMRGFWG